MGFWIAAVVVVMLVVAFIAVLGAKEDLSDMSEEKFEAEAKRSSMIGAGVAELHKVFQPNRVKTFVEEKHRVKVEKSFSGDKPHGPEDEALPKK
jgi:ABC-type bacteriocin/lantibiotic exporter with double-glycine peptidase domain